MECHVLSCKKPHLAWEFIPESELERSQAAWRLDHRHEIDFTRSLLAEKWRDFRRNLIRCRADFDVVVAFARHRAISY